MAGPDEFASRAGAQSPLSDDPVAGDENLESMEEPPEVVVQKAVTNVLDSKLVTLRNEMEQKWEIKVGSQEQSQTDDHGTHR